MKTIQSVEKAIQILDYIAINNDSLGLTELSRALDMSITTLHGFIATLEKCKYIQKSSQTGKYCLGEQIFRLGMLCNKQMILRSAARPYMEEIRDTVNETVHLALPINQTQIMYIEKAESNKPFRLTSLVGKIENAENSAIGIVLMEANSFGTDENVLLEVHENKNFCFKFEPDMDAYCIATAFVYSSSQDKAALSLVVPKNSFTEENKNIYISKLLVATNALENHFILLNE